MSVVIPNVDFVVNHEPASDEMRRERLKRPVLGYTDTDYMDWLPIGTEDGSPHRCCPLAI